jgi:hypothetical protein
MYCDSALGDLNKGITSDVVSLLLRSSAWAYMSIDKLKVSNTIATNK